MMRFGRMILIVLSIALFSGLGNVRAAESSALPAGIERPRQLFLTDLLARERGNWRFETAVGERITHPGTVSLTSRETPNAAISQLALLLDDPEFPNDDTRAVWKTIQPEADGSFLVEDPGFSMKATFEDAPGKTLRGTLSQIHLNGAAQSSGVLSGIFAWDGSRWITLLPGTPDAPRIESAVFAGTFTADEPVTLYFSAPSGDGEVVVEDLYRKNEIMRLPVHFTGAEQQLNLELEKFGCFEVTLLANGGDSTASCRIVRIPEPLNIAPQDSFMGMNIFQQQLWYHSCQLPLFAKAGIRWIRPWLHWENTWKFQEPRAGEFNTAPLDSLLRRLEAHDQKFEYIIYNFSPVLKLSSTEMSPLNEEQMASYLEYVRKIVTHCGDRVNDYEIWNEPDLLALKNTSFDARFYAELVRRSAAAIREVNPNASIHTMSHSSILSWLAECCAEPGVADATDVVTLHTYNTPLEFAAREVPRMELLDRTGFIDKPRYFNEIGHSGYDGCETYSAAYPIATERNQADSVAINYAQSLYFGGDAGKVFWFCSLDPRDSSNPAQHTPDSGYGMLYIGGVPKAALPALAATAAMLDGRRVLGRLEPVHGAVLLPFEGDRAILYYGGDRQEISALELGCAAGENLTVYDLFGNLIASGSASKLILPLDDGPLFIDGGATWGTTAAELSRAWRSQRHLTARAEGQVPPAHSVELKQNESVTIALALPAEAEGAVSVTPDAPFRLVSNTLRDGKLLCEIQALDQNGHGNLVVDVQLKEAELPQVRRVFPVSVGRDSFIANGGFDPAATWEFFDLSRDAVDPAEGASAPGALKFSGPWDERRHIHISKPYNPALPLLFRGKFKGHAAPDARISLNVAFFGSNRWLGTWSAAALGAETISNAELRGKGAVIPTLNDNWQSVEATLPAEALKDAENARVIFFIDCRGGKENDIIWIDDIELYQPQGGTL